MSPTRAPHLPAPKMDSPGAEHGVVSRKYRHVLMAALIDWRWGDIARRLPRSLLRKEFNMKRRRETVSGRGGLVVG